MRWGCAAALALGIGLAALAAWVTGHGAATSLSPDWEPIQPNAALGFALLGLSLQLRATRTAAIAAGLDAAIGAITCVEYLVHWRGGIDNVLIASGFGHPPGRMAPNAAIVLTIGGIVLSTRGLRRAHPQLLAIGGSLLSGLGLVALMGYATGLQGAYVWGVRQRWRRVPRSRADGSLCPSVSPLSPSRSCCDKPPWRRAPTRSAWTPRAGCSSRSHSS